MFPEWKKWDNRELLDGLTFPGVYILAITDQSIGGNEFSWLEEIVYVGMTNSKKGLKSRWYQFDRTIRGYTGHGGAKRFRYDYSDYKSLKSNLFVSARYFQCNNKIYPPKPEDLIIMGEVAKFEYVCIAEYMKRFGRRPKYNDTVNSPKGNY
ncbi:GIY-YIG nuclease family protein [Gracilimonas amylolytica]|uniref:hypothetical protein n=1 Tax=Gracilimonas amylolytica TaxID=1749045 RepID=UPI000CD8A7AB|nr:hypothetical protein [Gracilimonas amylolytica]